MSTLLEVKTAAASLLEKSVADLTVNGQDLWLLAANQVRKTAELQHDFEFNRRLVTVTVNGTTGGALAAAVDRNNVVCEIKTVMEVGLLDSESNLIPAVWTTVGESLERQREDNGFAIARYPTDGQARCGPNGQARFTISGDEVRRWPRTTTTDSTDYPLWLEAYVFTSDWTTSDVSAATVIVSGTLSPDAHGTYNLAGTYNGYPLYEGNFAATFYLFFTGEEWVIQISTAGLVEDVDGWILHSSSISPVGTYTPEGANTGTLTVTAGTGGVSNVWTTHGQQFLLWSTVVHLNKLFKVFVPRQEGNLPPPTDLADAGLSMLVEWDNNKLEQFRRHNR